MDTKQIHYDIWLARYGADGTYEGRTIWQCTDKGHVNGINGNVCLEFAYKDYAPKATKGTAVDTGEWKNESGKWYFYRDGGRMSGWINPDGYWYYLDPSELGAMVTGTTMTIDGVSYTFECKWCDAVKPELPGNRRQTSTFWMLTARKMVCFLRKCAVSG